METYTKYEVDIVCTGKSFASNDYYSMFDHKNEVFDSLGEVQEYLENTYSNCKRVKHYHDSKNGPEQTGWIYCFNSKDISHNSKAWRQQDWVTVRKHEITVVVP